MVKAKFPLHEVKFEIEIDKDQADRFERLAVDLAGRRSSSKKKLFTEMLDFYEKNHLTPTMLSPMAFGSQPPKEASTEKQNQTIEKLRVELERMQERQNVLLDLIATASKQG